MIDRLLAAHDGVITTRQAKDAGLSQDAIDRRVRSGRWRRTSRGVYFARDRPWTDTARVRCAVYSAGDSAVLSGVAAAYWHGLLTSAPSIIDITVPRTGRSRGSTGVRLRRRDLDPADVLGVRGLRLTAPPLTVLEASTELGVDIVDRALGKLLTPGHLRRAQNRNRGRTGARHAEKLIRDAEGGARSEAERRFAKILRAAGIRHFRMNYPYRGYVLDFAFPSARVCVEIDGWAFHSDPSAFQRDRERQNVLMREWTVLRYTWRDIVERPDSVVAQVSETLVRCSGPR